MNTLPAIEQIVKTATLITVLPVLGNEFTIDRAKFEVWADKNDKRDWGTTEGGAGVHSWDEYYQSDYFELDIQEYVTTVPEVAGIMAAFDKVLNSLK